MDKAFIDTVRLLLRIAPDVFDNGYFAMKGGTAINLFVRDMPRLSVDIDVAYVPHLDPRDTALQNIGGQLRAIRDRLISRGVESRILFTKDQNACKLMAEYGSTQVKVEVNTVFRGTVLQPEHRRLAAKTSAMFSADISVPTLSPDELYWQQTCGGP